VVKKCAIRAIRRASTGEVSADPPILPFASVEDESVQSVLWELEGDLVKVGASPAAEGLDRDRGVREPLANISG
jgi:hypothetical protein